MNGTKMTYEEASKLQLCGTNRVCFFLYKGKPVLGTLFKKDVDRCLDIWKTPSGETLETSWWFNPGDITDFMVDVTLDKPEPKPELKPAPEENNHDIFKINFGVEIILPDVGEGESYARRTMFQLEKAIFDFCQQLYRYKPIPKKFSWHKDFQIGKKIKVDKVEWIKDAGEIENPLLPKAIKRGNQS
ncbi:MAG: hypothetical protein KGL39_55550 [Patescibacteria group bacterium]|nr:hypothetical protein [Patescibacteria group bacterium]